MTKKILLTSGCSFSYEDWCWPGHLSHKINYDLINKSMSCQGNGLILKKLIYGVTDLLENTSNEDILVGVMWSGMDRHEFYLDYPKKLKNIDGWIENPTSVVEGKKNWMILNHHWKTPESEMWYMNYHSRIESAIFTIQNILMAQWFLKEKNIKYFMTTYMDIFNKWKNEINTTEVKYLYNLIDFNHFLPVNGCYEWVIENHKEKGFHNGNPLFNLHPISFGHEMFTNEVIIPYLIDKKILDEQEILADKWHNFIKDRPSIKPKLI